MDKVLDILKEIGTKGVLSVVFAAAVILIGFKLSSLIVKLMSKGKGFNKADPIFQSFAKSFISVALKTLVVITACAIMGVPTATIIAIIGSAGLAIGLALQGSLGNLAGGLMILLFRPFCIGDYIEVASNSGTVTEISVFYTTLLTPDRKVITVPNGTVSNSSLTNYSKSPTRRVDISFQLDPSNNIDEVKKIMLINALNDARVLNDPTPMAVISEHTDYSVTYTLRVWCEKDEFWNIFFDLTENIKKSFTESNIILPVKRLSMN